MAQPFSGFFGLLNNSQPVTRKGTQVGVRIVSSHFIPGTPRSTTKLIGQASRIVRDGGSQHLLYTNNDRYIVVACTANGDLYQRYVDGNYVMVRAALVLVKSHDGSFITVGIIVVIIKRIICLNYVLISSKGIHILFLTILLYII